MFLYNAIVFRFFFAAMNWTFFSFAAMNWTGEHRAFNAITSIKTKESAAAAQQAFRLNFNLGGYNRVPAQNTIMLRLTNFRTIESALKRKSTA